MRSARLPDAARYWRTPLLPGADLVTATYRDHTFPPHWHDAYTLPVIEAGAERYTYRGGRRLADTGSVPVINPGEIHTGSRATEDGWRYRVAYVPIDFLHALAGEIAGKPQPMPWFPDDAIDDADFGARLLLAYRLLEASGIDIADPGIEPVSVVRVEASVPATRVDPLAAETAMLDALSTLLVRHAIDRPRAPEQAADAPRIARMRERLAADLTAPVTLAELAQAIGLSPFHAARLFARATGMAPHAWRNQLRIQRALAPLRAGASVADVAAASGFVDQSHFTRHFKRIFGVPPGRWQGGRE